MAARPPAVIAARHCAYQVVRRVFERGAYADRAFHACAGDLSPRDRALGQAIAFGTVQRRLTLDHVAEALMDRSVRRLEPAVRAALQVGLFQLLFMGGVAEHAAVSESVELVKPSSPAGARLVNAVLRRATREGPALVGALHDRDPGTASLLHSVPVWLAEKWWSELGGEEARALLGRVNQPAESALRVNRLVGDREELAGQLPVASRPAPELPEGLVLEQAFDAHGSPPWRRGAIMPQSRASMLVGRVVDPQPGQRVADLCAAPGGKTSHLAALMEDRGAVVAVERRRA
jgi:16S rRNA (cytosine967-C5)-methyltransferase